MHAYASDSRDRFLVPGILALAAVGLAYGIHAGFAHFKIVLPWFIEAPAVMGVYGVLHLLYNRWFWKVRFRRRNVSPIPDLNGSWKGRLVSSYKDEYQRNVEKDCCLSIRQTWLDIMVVLETDSSRSWSTMAAVYSRDSAHFGLKYDYTNEPFALADDDLEEHRGTAQLRYTSDSDVLTGDYYTGRGRLTVGTFEFKRVGR